MNATDVVEVVEALTGAGVRIWIDGGWGIDALLGRQTRDHADLDLALDRERLPKAREALEGLGFHHDADAEPGLPARFVMVDPKGRQVDFHPLKFDDVGDGWQQLTIADDEWGRYPAQDLGSRGSIGGREVRCLSPELQVRFHLGYDWNEADEQDLRLLTETFRLPMPDQRPTGQ
jgi:lincosamide nucleotidyltransferase A/C/D/E